MTTAEHPRPKQRTVPSRASTGHPAGSYLPAIPAPEELGPPSQDAVFPDLPRGVTQLLFTAEQAGALLAMRASWLQRAAADGTIACTYLGRFLRFSHTDLHSIITVGACGYRPENDDQDPGGA